MKKNNWTAIFRIGSLCVLAVFVTVGARVSSAQSEDAREISHLLSNSQAHAMVASNHADEMAAFARSRFPWQAYLPTINVIKDQFNAIGGLYPELAALRDAGSPGQQRAIEQMQPLLQTTADTLTATINYLNKNHDRAGMPEFREYIRHDENLTNELSNLIKDAVTYDQSRTRAAAMQQKLASVAG